MLLEASRVLGKDPQAMVHKASRIMLFQEFSPAVIHKRMAFEEVKKGLRDLNIQYPMRYQAMLRFSHGGSLYNFGSPEKAKEFLDSLK
ncbi:hypothetical protein chiPu_0011834 [Chiloscyllium punctatum]|uniref:Uncharacterized protein n=1 Tax=Chiloscyllium punctatum TaxID=137246 RepID=A0A401SSJ2_CHIPU|nr:hypothetical protein [Chiloscyllium punctatum]